MKAKFTEVFNLVLSKSLACTVLFWILGAPSPARGQYTTSGTSQAWTSYNNAFYTAGANGGSLLSDKQGGSTFCANCFWEETVEIETAEDAYYWAKNNGVTDLTPYKTEIDNLCTGFGDNVTPGFVGPGGKYDWSADNFNDDLNWAIIAFARAYQITGNANWLTAAETNFNTVWSRAQAQGGLGNGMSGLMQSQPHGTGWTEVLDCGVNFNFVNAGYVLYQITGNASYKADADNVYAWAMTNLYLTTVNDGAGPGVCVGNPSLTCAKIYDGTNGHSDYTKDYGLAMQAALHEGDYTKAQYMANWLMFNSNNPNFPYIGTYTLNGTAWNVLPDYGQGGGNDSGYNGIAMRGIGYGLSLGAFNATTLAWAQANVSAAWSIRNANNISWNNWLANTPATGLYAWDVSSAMSALLNIPNDALSVTAPAAGSTTQPVTLTATLAPAMSTPVATGTVQFYANGTAIGSTATISGNVATLSYTFASAGAYAITATYSGDTTYYAANAQPASIAITTPNFSITPVTTSYTLTSGAIIGNTDIITVASPNTFAGTVALTCAVTNTTGSAAGTCTLSPGSVTLTAGSSTSSTLTIATTPGTSGTLNVAVTGISGSTTINAATIAVTLTASSFTITPPPSTITVPAGGSQSSTLTLASVNGFAGTVALTCAAANTSGTAAGSCSLSPSSVTLTAEGTASTTATINANPGTSGALLATISASGTTAGATISATSSATVAATVVTPSFMLSVAPTALSFTSGAIANNSTVATIASVNYFTSAVNISCSLSSSTATFQPACSVSPGSLTPAANATATSTITISSTVVQAHNTLPWPTLPIATLALSLMFPRRRRKIASLFVLSLMLFATASLVGCGGSNSLGAPGNPTPRSSAGSYTLTITAASGSATQTATAAVTIN